MNDISQSQQSLEISIVNTTRSLHRHLMELNQEIVDTKARLKESLSLPARVRRRPIQHLIVSMAVGGALGALTAGTHDRRPARTQADPRVGALAFAGLLVNMLRPVVVAAAKEILTRKVTRHFEREVGMDAQRASLANPVLESAPSHD